MSDIATPAEKAAHALFVEAGPSGKPLITQGTVEAVDTAFGEGAGHVVAAGAGEWVKALSQGHLPTGKKSSRAR